MPAMLSRRLFSSDADFYYARRRQARLVMPILMLYYFRLLIAQKARLAAAYFTSFSRYRHRQPLVAFIGADISGTGMR